MKKALITAVFMGQLGLAGTAMAQGPWTYGSWATAQQAMPKGSAEVGERLAKRGYCYSCHGEKGVAPSPNAPSLAGQDPVFTYKALLDYKSGLFHMDHKSDVMQAVTRPMTQQDMADLAAYYAVQKRPRGAGGMAPPPSGAMCMGCHAADGGPGPGHAGPALGGQSEFYLKRQLHAFKNRHRQTEVGGMMGSMMQSVSDAQIEALAAYYSSL